MGDLVWNLFMGRERGYSQNVGVLIVLVSSICAARPVHIQSDLYRSCSTVKQRRAVCSAPSRWGATKNSAVALSSRNDMIYTPEECADEWRQNNADLKLLENCVINGFIMFDIMSMTATGLENSPQSFDVYTVSQSRSVVTPAENPAPKNSPWSQLENSAMGTWPIYKNYYTSQTSSTNGVI